MHKFVDRLVLSRIQSRKSKATGFEFVHLLAAEKPR